MLLSGVQRLVHILIHATTIQPQCVSLFSPFSNVIVRRTIVSSDGVSDRGGELGLSNDVEKRQLRHNSQNFQARYFVEIDLIT